MTPTELAWPELPPEGILRNRSPLRSAGLKGDGGWQNISSTVQAAAAYYGVSDFTIGAMQFQRHTGQVVVKLFRGTEKERPELYRKASPIFYVSKDDPPLLLAHGEKETWFPLTVRSHG